MTKDIKTRCVPKSAYGSYLKKAEEFFSSAQDGLVKHKGFEENIAHLRHLIAMKSIVEYDQRLINRSEAVILSRHAERFLAWVRSILPKS